MVVVKLTQALSSLPSSVFCRLVGGGGGGKEGILGTKLLGLPLLPFHAHDLYVPKDTPSIEFLNLYLLQGTKRTATDI